MTTDWSIGKPIVITDHARVRMGERGAREEDVLAAVRIGDREPARRGRVLCRLTLEFNREWDGKYYGAQQVAPVIVEKEHQIVVVTVLTFYIRERGTP
ncbi:MAG: DUF4258 domain-containing protein [Acidobacteria bacterium]|nr:DUF4258 domain-containing protein [Acidobacteriota bacterium]